MPDTDERGGGALAARSVIQSPLLVGRDEYVGLATRRLGQAATGAGQLLLVAGEAGIGKTRLLGVIAEHAQSAGFTLVRAAAYPGDAESSGGLLMDLASSLAHATDAGLRPAGAEMAERLRAGAIDSGDAHRRRRLLVQDMVDRWPEPTRPHLIILEDLHWADQLSLDVVAHLAGRLRHWPLLLAGAYRSDELYPRIPMRELRNRLLSQRLAEEIRLDRLGLEGTAALTASVLGFAPPAAVVAALYQRSDGIPLHVEELLATIDDESLTAKADAVVQAVAVPDTLADAVRGRSAQLAPRTRAVAAAAAVIGRSFDFDLLTAVTGADEDDVANALRELQEAYLVMPGAEASKFDFRHALIRDALYAETDLPTRRRLHERVAGIAAERGYRDAFISAHYEQAQCAGEAYRHALAAAREAAAVSAHGEAFDLYRRALRHAPADLDAAEHARLRSALGDEAAAADDNEAATEAYQQAVELWRASGDRRAAASVVPRLVAAQHLLGVGLDARIGLLAEAKTTLEDLDAEAEQAQLDSAMAAAYMLDRRLDHAIAYGAPARVASQRAGDESTAINVAATLGAVYVFAGRMDEGWDLIAEAVERSRRTEQEAEAARCFRMMGSAASVVVEYDRAERWLTEGIQYAERVELWNHRHYMAAHLAHVRWATGEWGSATQIAKHALADGRGGLTTRITALYVLGYLALGQGELVRAEKLLQEAYAEGLRMDELQRLSPPLWGLAELARCRAEADLTIELCERGYAASAPVNDSAYLFPFLLTGVRVHLDADDIDAASEWIERVSEPLRARSIPGTLPAIDHAWGLVALARGDVTTARPLLESAAAAWVARRRFWEGTWARLDLAGLAVKARRRAEGARLFGEVIDAARAAHATTLGNEATARRDAADAGRGADPWYPLSAREFEVARLVAEGLTNREIAERMVLAPKTISAHVEHILTKLDASRRAEIAAWCARVLP